MSIQLTQVLHLEHHRNGRWQLVMSGATGDEPIGVGYRIVRVKYQHGAQIERWCRGCDRDADKCKCAKQ